MSMCKLGMNKVKWAVLSEWDEINTEIKVLVSSGLKGDEW